MGFSRQEYWSGLLFPPPEDHLDPGLEPAIPALAGRFFTAEPPLCRVRISVHLAYLNVEADCLPSTLPGSSQASEKLN